jgi:predicted metal-dependent HD superfamily phosphohydrolase
MVPFVRTGYEDFLPDLQEKWNQAHPNDSTDIFKKIVNNHTQKGRYYHNLSHLLSMLLLLDEYPNALQHKREIQLTIFFHDIIYDATKKGNEEKSARIAQKLLGEHYTQLIQQLILSTKKHQPLNDLHENAVLLDLDLAILGSSLELYDAYRTAIRMEYNVYPNLLYNPGRKKVLQKFLEREKLYFTDYFHEKYEQQARSNLNWEIEQLDR